MAMMMLQNYDHTSMMSTYTHIDNTDRIPFIMARKRKRTATCIDNTDRIHDIMTRKKKRRATFKTVNESNKTVETDFDIETKYVPITLIGGGSYGVVCSCTNTVTNEKVAIKKITNALENSEEALKVLRELILLRHARHGNVISLKDVMIPSAKSKDIYLVFELMHRDLESIIYSVEPISQECIKYLMFQLLFGLSHVHSANIIHCDLKPANLLVNEDSMLKIGDFGLARTTNEKVYCETNCIVSLWYRAPELLLNCDTFGKPIDIWSVGCIFAELLGRRELFRGKDINDQIHKIIRILGTQHEADLRFVTNCNGLKLLKAMPDVPRLESFLSLFPKADPLAIDLLEKMLKFDPSKRITAKEALQHPYLSYYEPDMTEPAPDLADINVDPHIATRKIRNMIWNEMSLYHPETAPYR